MLVSQRVQHMCAQIGRVALTRAVVDEVAAQVVVRALRLEVPRRLLRVHPKLMQMIPLDGVVLWVVASCRVEFGRAADRREGGVPRVADFIPRDVAPAHVAVHEQGVAAHRGFSSCCFPV